MWIVLTLFIDNKDITKIKDIGYREIGQYLQGLLSLEETKEIIKQKTRNYAKRQLTWFRNKMKCQFINIDYNNQDDSLLEAIKMIHQFLEQR